MKYSCFHLFLAKISFNFAITYLDRFGHLKYFCLKSNTYDIYLKFIRNLVVSLKFLDSKFISPIF